MQPLRFIFIQQDNLLQRQSTNPQTAAAHFCFWSANSTFTNQTFANQGNQESRYEFAARRSLHAGTDPNEVCWKNLLRHLHLRIPQPAGSRSEIISCVHMLELA